MVNIMATPNSTVRFDWRRRSALVLGVSSLLVTSTLLPAAATNSVEKLAASRAQAAYAQARERFEKETNDVEAAWQFGRACFDRADLPPDNPQRADIAQQGIRACLQAIGINPKLAPAHYYMGLNLGQLARTKRFSALHLLDEMEAALSAAIALDPAYDYAGPHRSLGLLYKDAPGWPISLGGRSKARLHLEKAAQLSPDYPDNRLCLLEAYLGWGEKKKVQSSMAAVETVLQTSRTNLTGEAWALSWHDWDTRWAKLKSQAASSTVAESPKHKQR